MVLSECLRFTRKIFVFSSERDIKKYDYEKSMILKGKENLKYNFLLREVEMVEVVVRVGEKGQVLIPKLFRDSFGILPGHHAILSDTEQGLLLRKSSTNPIKLFEETAHSIKKSKKDIESVSDQYKERFKRSGVLR